MSAPPSAALGPYRLVERIAVGGMAEVFRAERVGAAGGVFVVKRLLPHLAADPAFVAMFTDEARLMERLDHPNLVKVHDHGEERGQHWLGMEHVAGATLSEVLATRAPLPASVALHVAAEVCAALAYVHAFAADGLSLGIVHRDVTPGNVFLGRDGRVKLGDFGVAKARGRTAVTTRGQIKGTLAYMAPEQARGEDVDARVDLYAVGLLLFEMLTGRRYLVGENEAEVLKAAMDPPPFDAARLPAGLGDACAAILRRALHPLADARHRGAADLERELRQAAAARQPGVGSADVAHLLDGLAPRAASAPAPATGPDAAAGPARRATVVQTPPPATRRRRAPLVAGVLLAGSAVAVAVWLMWGGTGGPSDGRGHLHFDTTGFVTTPASQPAPTPPPATQPQPRPTPPPPPQQQQQQRPKPSPPPTVPPPPRPPAADAGPAEAPPRPVVDLAAIDDARKRRGLVPGDAPRCDEGRARVHKAPDALAAALVTTCYRDFPVDRAFIDAKLARLARRIAAAGREADPAIQALSKRVLDLSVGGRFDEANRVLNELQTALR
jgi:serine/threonine-protein kinase